MSKTSLYGKINKAEQDCIDLKRYVPNAKVEGTYIVCGGQSNVGYIIGFLTTDDLVDPKQTVLVRVGASLKDLLDRCAIRLELGPSSRLIRGMVTNFHVFDNNPIALMEVELEK